MPAQSIKVALIQMVSGSDVEENLKRAETLAREASRQGAQWIALPEYFYFMGPQASVRRVAEPAGQGPIQTRMSELARSLGVLLLAGSLPLLDKGQDRVSSASVLFGPDGSPLARYDKMHLFDIDVPQSGERHRESDDFLAGRAPVCVRTPLASIGLSICYDLRFPELYRTLMREGAEILTVPAAFTEATGRAHWHVLLRSRAIENQCFIVAPNQGGAHPDGKRTFGHSLVVNPWGEIIAEAGMGEDVVIADLKLGELRDLRARFPVLQHRRL